LNVALKCGIELESAEFGLIGLKNTEFSLETLNRALKH
jgi:hypothetical protein